MLDVAVTLHGTVAGESEVVINVPERSRLRVMASAGHPVDVLVDSVLESLDSAVRDALHVIVVRANRLPVAVAGDVERPPVVLDLEVLLSDFGGENAEVRLKMPDPTVFRRAMAEGESLASISQWIASMVRREVAEAFRVQVVGGGMLQQQA